MYDICVVFGTRPEAIKLGPVVAELKTLGCTPAVVATGQHWDLLKGTPAESDLAGATSLGLASDGIVTRWTTTAERALTARFKLAKPKIVGVQGDTMSALAAATAASSLGIPVAHVEAGLRSHNLQNPWPEERARCQIREVATWHYAPTATAYTNLVQEGVDPAHIRITGNTVVSALARYAPNAVPDPVGEALAVVTMHRREIQTPALASLVYRELYKLAMANPALRVFWSVHPAYARHLSVEPVMPPNVTMTSPAPYADFVATVARARFVVTDSGGLVEEAATLGVPTVIWRDVNDRPEAVAAGIAVMAKVTLDSLAPAVERACLLRREPTTVFGGVEAARLVAQHLVEIV